MNSISTKIVNKLKEYDINIFSKWLEDDETIILTSDVSISIKENDVLFLNFHISCKPSYAARFVLILKELKEIKTMIIGDDFIFDENGQFINGEQAIEYHQTYKKDCIIRDFLKEQTNLYVLTTLKPFNC